MTMTGVVGQYRISLPCHGAAPHLHQLTRIALRQQVASRIYTNRGKHSSPLRHCARSLLLVKGLFCTPCRQRGFDFSSLKGTVAFLAL